MQVFLKIFPKMREKYMARYSEDTVSAAIERLKDFLGVESDVELAKQLGISKHTINSWKHRGSFNVNTIENKIPGISLDWVLFGEGEPIKDKAVFKEYFLGKTDLFKGHRAIIKALKVEEPTAPYEYYMHDKYTTKGIDRYKKDKFKIPILYNSISAGDPNTVFDEIKGWYYPEHLLNNDTIVVHINKEIDNQTEFNVGDNVIVDTSREPKNSDTVLISRDNYYEFMIFLKDETGQYLQTLNAEKKFKFEGNFEIEGVVIAKIKKF